MSANKQAKQILHCSYIYINNEVGPCMGRMLVTDAEGSLYKQNSHYVTKTALQRYNVIFIECVKGNKYYRWNKKRGRLFSRQNGFLSL